MRLAHRLSLRRLQLENLKDGFKKAAGRVGGCSTAEQAATEFEERAVNISTALETSTEATEVMQPGTRAPNDPAILAKAAAMFGPALGSHRLDTAIAQRMSMSLGVGTAIGVDHTRPLQWVAAQSANRWNRVDQRQPLLDVVDVRTGQDRGERGAVGVSDDVVTVHRPAPHARSSLDGFGSRRCSTRIRAGRRRRTGRLRASRRAPEMPEE